MEKIGDLAIWDKRTKSFHFFVVSEMALIVEFLFDDSRTSVGKTLYSAFAPNAAHFIWAALRVPRSIITRARRDFSVSRRA